MARILLLCWRDSEHPQGGGSERYLERVGAGLANAGHTVIYRTSRPPLAAATDLIDGLPISRGGGRLTVYPRALASLIAARFHLGPLAELGVPDMIIDTQNGVPFFARLITRAPVVLLVHHCHRDQWPIAGYALSKLGWFLERRVSPWVHRDCQYLTVSTPSAQELIELGVDAARIAVVRNGVDPVPQAMLARNSSRTANAGARSERLVVLSRLVPHKQVEHAIETVAHLQSEFPGLELDIIGDGWWGPQLREHADRYGIRSAVTFHGHVSEDEKHRLLSRATVHLMPSQKEGWGLAVIEAAQHRVPTIGYRSATGLRDSIVDGQTGVLVDDAPQLAQHTAALLRSPENREQLARAAYQRSKEFSWSKTTLGVHLLIEAVRAGKRIAGVIELPETSAI